MGIKHLFKTRLFWTKTIPSAEMTARIYHKNHYISIDGKQDLSLSAAKSFKGDPTRYNPEDLLLSSISSCHMMSYLYLCQQNGIDIISYTDQAEGILETLPNNSGRFIEVKLNPIIVIADKQKLDLAKVLHHQANELCFIANSCNFPINHDSKITSLESSPS